MAGMLLVILGVTGMGTAVKFIPRPVVIGFTNGIAVLIASTQIKDFCGLHLAKVPSEFWLRMKALAATAPSFSLTATLLAAGTVATMLICRVISPRIPGAIVAILGATATAYLFKLPVETVGTRFGGFPADCRILCCPPGTRAWFTACSGRPSPWPCSGPSNR
jgi:sulfate permease, SulP family